MHPHNKSYPNYGGRGIFVCERWSASYDAFLEDMGHPTEGQTLERIDCNGPYSPENCRWASWSDQANNKRTNRLISHNGKTQTMAQWASDLGITKGALYRRLKAMSTEDALVSGSIAKKAEHGTRHMYSVHGCRCDECRAENTRHHRERRNKRRVAA